MSATTSKTLVWREIGCTVKVLVRDPQAAFLTAGLPLLYLFVFASIFGDEQARLDGQPGTMAVATVMTASVVVIGVVSSAFQNLTITLVQDREFGVLKRLRSAPVPTPVFLAGHVVSALLMSVVLGVLVAGLGMLVYDVPFTGTRTLAAAVTLLVGALACCLAAFPFTVLVRKPAAAMPMALGMSLTLFFLSGNFFPGKDLPRAMGIIADAFPVRHFFVAMLTAFNPNVTGAGFEWEHLAVLGIWVLAGAGLAIRFFRWTPTGEE